MSRPADVPPRDDAFRQKLFLSVTDKLVFGLLITETLRDDQGCHLSGSFVPCAARHG